jgi:hypothetical protein
MSKIFRATKCVLPALALACAALPIPAFAEMQVVSSTAPSLSVGAKLPDDANFNVDEGEVVRVVKGGKTYEIAGPYTGTLEQYRSTCAWWQDVLGKCAKRPVDDGNTPGATRGLGMDEPPSK